MKEQIETLKKWVSTGQVKTARGRSEDDLLTLIGQMQVALSQPRVSGSLQLPKCKCGQNALPYKAQIEIDKCSRCRNDR